MSYRTIVIAIAITALAAGCGRPGEATEEGAEAGMVPVDVTKSDPERLLRYYFASYTEPEPSDPFEAGLLVSRDGQYFVVQDSLAARDPAAAGMLVDADGNGRYEWEEMEAFIQATYPEARRLPQSLDVLRSQVGFDGGTEPWFEVEVHGVMTTSLRRIHVKESALREALRAAPGADRRILYPVGTVFIAEHHEGDEHVETTVMQKRSDGFWDYFIYDASGALSGSTSTPPRELRAPLQCVGCHFGEKLFEPEKSFPEHAEPGPHGPRQLYVDDAARDRQLTAFFDEHRRRSDGVLGLYATLFTAQLMADRRAGRLSKADEELLSSLGL